MDVANNIFNGLPLAWQSAERAAPSLSLRPLPEDQRGGASLRQVSSEFHASESPFDTLEAPPHARGFASLGQALDDLNPGAQTTAAPHGEDETYWQSLLRIQEQIAETRRAIFDAMAERREESRERDAAQAAEREEQEVESEQAPAIDTQDAALEVEGHTAENPPETQGVSTQEPSSAESTPETTPAAPSGIAQPSDGKLETAAISAAIDDASQERRAPRLDQALQQPATRGVNLDLII